MSNKKDISVEKLSNGLTLVRVPMSGVASVAVLALVGVGSRYDTKKTAGLAHFYEHLVVMGTKKYPTNFELTHKIEEVGADFNAFTAEEYTGFYIKTEGRHLPMALEMISQLLTQPLLKQSEIDRERLVILEEIKMREDNPQIKVYDRLTEIVFSDCNLGIPGAGTATTVNTLQKPLFKKLKKQHYTASNTILIVAGNINAYSKTGKNNINLNKLVSQSFSDFNPGASTSPKGFTSNQKESKVDIINKSTDQIHLGIGFQTFSRHHPQRYAINLLSVILGSGFTSRLFQKIRQQNSLAYSVNADIDLYSDTGQFTVSAGVDHKRLNKALNEILKELEAVKGKTTKKSLPVSSKNLSKPITAQELRKAKDYLRGKIVLRLEDPLNLAMYYGGQQLLDNQIKTWNQVLEKIETVTINDIEKVARTIFNPKLMSLVVVGKNIKKTNIDIL